MSDVRPLVITGATGFVGANLCRFFTGQNRRVIGVEGPRTSAWRCAGIPGVERVKLDLALHSDVAKFISEVQPAIVINCAAYGGYPSQSDAEQIYSVNFAAVHNLLNCLHGLSGFEAFIQAGSSSEYGWNCKRPLEDKTAAAPDSHYAVAKLAATNLVQLYGRKFGMPAWTLRLYSVYGPFEESSRLIPTLLAAAAANRLPPLVDPEISRDFIYVDDVSQAFAALLSQTESLAKGGIFNIGTGQLTTIGTLVALSRKLFNIEAQPVWGSMERRHWDQMLWVANPHKAQRVLGWRAKTTLTQGLIKTMAWTRANPQVVSESMEKSILKGA